MTTIELMLEASELALEMIEYWSQGRADILDVAKIKAAIAAGEQELKREPVGKVVSSGPADFPSFQWISADHSLRCPTGTFLYTREETK
jgi:hypothetical protein